MSSSATACRVCRCHRNCPEGRQLHACSASHAIGPPGFSTVELLVAIAILIVLAAVGSVAHTGYMLRVHTDLSKHQQDDLTDRIDVAVDLIQSGAKTNLVEPVSGDQITNESTCADFLESLKETTAHLRNPFDGSPAVTFSTGYDIYQKRGKIRIT